MTALRELSPSSARPADIHSLLAELSRQEGGKADDVSRGALMVDPSLPREWINLSKGGDAVAELGLRLASRHPNISTEGMAEVYEKRGSLGSVQSTILLSPWRARGWQKLKYIKTK